MTTSSPVDPNEEDRKVIETFARALEDVPVDHALLVVEGKKTDSLAVPRPADQMGKGKAISVVPTRMLVTTQQAADLLGVSRQHVVKLITEKEIPYEKVGTHRRIRMEDLIAYRRRRESSPSVVQATRLR